MHGDLQNWTQLLHATTGDEIPSLAFRTGEAGSFPYQQLAGEGRGVELMQVPGALDPLPVGLRLRDITRVDHLTVDATEKKPFVVLSSFSRPLQVMEIEVLQVSTDVGDVPKRAFVQFLLTKIGFEQSADMVNLIFSMTCA